MFQFRLKTLWWLIAGEL